MFQIHLSRLDKKLLNQQSQHWENNFSNKPEMFGFEPSFSAKKALETFKKNNITNIIELGAGLGRDTIFFAQNGIYVHAIDYSLSATNIIKKRSKENNLDALIKVENYDIEKNLIVIMKIFKHAILTCCSVWLFLIKI